MSEPDPFERQRVLVERFERLEARLLPFLEPLVKGALRRGVMPPRYDPDLEDIQNVLFMIPKDDPIRREIEAYEAQKKAGRTTHAWEDWQVESVGRMWSDQAVSLSASALQNIYLNRIMAILAPGKTTWGDGRVITAPHVKFYRDAGCIGGDMLPVDLDPREIDDFFWHTVLPVDEVRGALAAYKASLPHGTVIDEDLGMILDDFLKDVKEEMDKDAGP